MEKAKNYTIQAVLIALISASTVLAGQWLGWWEKSVARQDDYAMRWSQCVEDINALKDEVRATKTRLQTVELATVELPFPFWIKDLESNALYLSNSYIETVLDPLGISKNQIIGTKGEIFGLDFVQEIVAHDLEVIKKDCIMVYREDIPNLSNGLSYKYPLHGNFGQVVGTAGIWIPNKHQITSK